MARFRLDREYVGTRYSGWQIQKNARTVQGALHAAVREVAKRTDFESYGAGRTDAGVHALQQVAHLDLETRLPPATLRRALNDALPADVNVLRVEKVTRQFHARHSAVARSYLYQIARRRTAFGKPFVWWIKDPLETAAIATAGKAFVGMHDFGSYSEARGGARDRAGHVAGAGATSAAEGRGRAEGMRGGATSGARGAGSGAREAGRAAREAAGAAGERETRVKIERVEVVETGDLLLVRVLGSHFLWKMVRRMVGVMAEVGRAGLTPRDAERFLHERSQVPATLTAPPSGLFLERVLYEGDAPPGPPTPVLNL
jgi:tRNA pseudouridine38-40 synthase